MPAVSLVTSSVLLSFHSLCGYGVMRLLFMYVLLRGKKCTVVSPSFPVRRNTHGVPEYKIRSMMDRFEKRVTVESVLAYAPSPSR